MKIFKKDDLVYCVNGTKPAIVYEVNDNNRLIGKFTNNKCFYTICYIIFGIGLIQLIPCMIVIPMLIYTLIVDGWTSGMANCISLSILYGCIVCTGHMIKSIHQRYVQKIYDAYLRGDYTYVNQKCSFDYDSFK